MRSNRALRASTRPARTLDRLKKQEESFEMMHFTINESI